jgi:hypothetical protein
VERGLLGDQRANDLPADGHQIARSEIDLMHPLVGTTLVG